MDERVWRCTADGGQGIDTPEGSRGFTPCPSCTLIELPLKKAGPGTYRITNSAESGASIEVPLTEEQAAFLTIIFDGLNRAAEDQYAPTIAIEERDG